MPSSRRTNDPRRKTFLNLSAQIEGQLREAYDRKYQAGQCTQTSLAKKLGVNRSAVHHRLMGHSNMTIETIADMVWALDHAIDIEIFDPTKVHSINHFICSDNQQVPAASAANVPPKSTLPPELESLLKMPPVFAGT